MPLATVLFLLESVCWAGGWTERRPPMPLTTVLLVHESICWAGGWTERRPSMTFATELLPLSSICWAGGWTELPRYWEQWEDRMLNRRDAEVSRAFLGYRSLGRRAYLVT